MNRKFTIKAILLFTCLVFVLMPTSMSMAQSKVNINLSKSYSENEYTLGVALENAKKELAEAEANEKRVREANGNDKTVEELKAEIKKLQEAKKNPTKYFLENRSAQYESGLTLDRLLNFINTEPDLIAFKLTDAEKAKIKALVEESFSSANINRALDLIKVSNEIRKNPDIRPYDATSAIRPQLPAIPNGELKVSADLMMFSAVSNAVSTVVIEKNKTFGHHYVSALGKSQKNFIFNIFNLGYGENLAWGYQDPFKAWFEDERIKYINGTYKNEYEIGHYTSLMSNAHKITGFTVHNTVVFGYPSPASEQCFGRDNNQRTYIGVEQFRNLFNQVSSEIDAKISEKQEELRKAENSGSNAAIMEAVKRTNAAKEKLKEAQAAYDANKQIRLSGSDRYETSYAVAEQMKINKGISKFENIVVASGDNYPDALSGNYLAMRKKAPMLLTNKREVQETAKYIKNNISPNGTVYILGQTGTVPGALEQMLSGIKVKRLGGADRFDTNEMILKEAGVRNEELLVCSGLNFPDAVSASAAGRPILLVGKDLSSSQLRYISTINPSKVYFIGGENAVSTAIRNKFSGNKVRIAGDDRFETSRLVAEALFPSNQERLILASGLNFPDALVGGAFNQDLGVPVIIVGPGRYGCENARKFVSEHGTKSLILLGGEGVLSPEMIKSIRN